MRVLTEPGTGCRKPSRLPLRPSKGHRVLHLSVQGTVGGNIRLGKGERGSSPSLWGLPGVSQRKGPNLHLYTLRWVCCGQIPRRRQKTSSTLPCPVGPESLAPCPLPRMLTGEFLGRILGPRQACVFWWECIHSM